MRFLTSVLHSFLYIFPIVSMIEEELYLHMLAWPTRRKLSLRLVSQNSRILYISDPCARYCFTVQIPSVSIWMDNVSLDAYRWLLLLVAALLIVQSKAK